MLKFQAIHLVSAFALAAAHSGSALAQHGSHDHAPEGDRAHREASHEHASGEREHMKITEPYPLATCPVSGQKLGAMGDPAIRVIDGREVRFCCEGCIEKFEKDTRASFEKIDAQIIREQLPFYPLTVCVVSGEALSEGGEDFAINHVAGNRLYRLCCKDCVEAVRRHPEEIRAKLDAAVRQQQRDRYPLDVCIVSGEELGEMGEVDEIVIANRLYRLCCKPCEKKLRSDPVKFARRLDAAWKARGMPTPTDELRSDPSHAHEHGEHEGMHGHDGGGAGKPHGSHTHEGHKDRPGG